MSLGHNLPVTPFTFIGAMSYKIKSLLSPKCMMTERLLEDVLKKGQPLPDWWRVRWLCHWSSAHSALAPPLKRLLGDWASLPHKNRWQKRNRESASGEGWNPYSYLLTAKLCGGRIAWEEKAVDISTRLKLYCPWWSQTWKHVSCWVSFQF